MRNYNKEGYIMVKQTEINCTVLWYLTVKKTYILALTSSTAEVFWKEAATE